MAISPDGATTISHGQCWQQGVPFPATRDPKVTRVRTRVTGGSRVAGNGNRVGVDQAPVVGRSGRIRHDSLERQGREKVSMRERLSVQP